MRLVFTDFFSSLRDDKEKISENQSHQPHQWSKPNQNLFRVRPT
jgi:hypothetical protein